MQQVQVLKILKVNENKIKNSQSNAVPACQDEPALMSETQGPDTALARCIGVPGERGKRKRDEGIRDVKGLLDALQCTL